MYHLSSAYIDADVIGLAVMVVIEIDDVTDLEAVQADLSSVRALHVGAVGKPDAVICPVAVHGKSGAVEAAGRRTAGNVFASDKASDKTPESA